jgi:hypothetical protein
MEAQDSDPIAETTAVIEDLRNLSHLDLSQLEQPKRTSARLALIAYCHT